MRNRRFVRSQAVVCGLALLIAACGNDDDEPARDDDGEETTTTEAGGEGGGELVGAKGTTPAPETTEPSTAFQARMDAHADAAGIDLDGTYAYGPESYDSTIIIALAAQAAGTTAARTPPRSSTSPRAARSAAPTPTAWP